MLLNREISSATTDVVISDNTGGGRAVAEAIVSRGHRRIALIGGPDNTSTSRDRELGVTEQLRASGAPLDPRLRRVGASTAMPVAISRVSTSSRPIRDQPPCSLQTT